MTPFVHVNLYDARTLNRVVHSNSLYPVQYPPFPEEYYLRGNLPLRVDAGSYKHGTFPRWKEWTRDTAIGLELALPLRAIIKLHLLAKKSFLTVFYRA